MIIRWTRVSSRCTSHLALETLPLDALDHLCLSYNLVDRNEQAYTFAREMCLRFADSERSWLRLADAARRNEQHKFAMLAYAQAMQLAYERRNEKIQDYARKKICQCASEHVEWGCAFGEDEAETIPEEFKRRLHTPWSRAMRQSFVDIYSDEEPKRSQLPRVHYLIPFTNPKEKTDTPGTEQALGFENDDG